MDFPKVLELGCGNGSFGARVAQRFAQNVDKPYRYVKPEVSMDTVSKLETDSTYS
jgi:tRNA G46 methylase TrmB